MRGRWGRLGPFEFAVGVRNLDRALERLGELGIELRSKPKNPGPTKRSDAPPTAGRLP
jgi:hypothetical protein